MAYRRIHPTGISRCLWLGAVVAVLAAGTASAIEVELTSGGKIDADRVEFNGTRFEIYQGGQRFPMPPDRVRFLRADNSAGKELERLRAELKKAHAEADRLREEKVAAGSASPSQQQLGANLRTAQERIQGLQEDLKKARDEAAKLQTAMSQTKQSVSDKEKTLEDVRSQLQAAQKQLTQAEETCKRLEARVAKLAIPVVSESDLEIDQVSHGASRGEGLVEVRARIVNKGKAPYRTVIVQAALYDSEDKLVATASTCAGNLIPGAPRYVRMDAPAEPGKVARVEVAVAETYPALEKP